MNEYQYPLSFKLINRFIIGTALVALMVAVFFSVNRGSLLENVFSVILFIFFGMLIIAGMIMFPDIKASEEGMDIKFFYKTLNVPWDQVLSLRNGGFGMRDSTIVTVKKLTIFHKILACAYGEFDYSVFLIQSQMPNYLDLLGKIEERSL